MNPDEEKAPAKGTEYVVLRAIADGGIGPGWRVIGDCTANSREEAAKKVAADTAGEYKAVPTRSWSETIEVTVEQVTKVTAKVV